MLAKFLYVMFFPLFRLCGDLGVNPLFTTLQLAAPTDCRGIGRVLSTQFVKAADETFIQPNYSKVAVEF